MTKRLTTVSGDEIEISDELFDYLRRVLAAFPKMSDEVAQELRRINDTKKGHNV